MFGWMVGRLVSCWGDSLRQEHLVQDEVDESSFSMIIRPWSRGRRSNILQLHSLLLLLLFTSCGFALSLPSDAKATARAVNDGDAMNE